MTGAKNNELIPKPSARSLANADSWFWLAFASVIFFIVTTVAALYMQTFENNIRNYHIAKDYITVARNSYSCICSKVHGGQKGESRGRQ